MWTKKHEAIVQRMKNRKRCTRCQRVVERGPRARLCAECRQEADEVERVGYRISQRASLRACSEWVRWRAFQLIH